MATVRPGGLQPSDDLVEHLDQWSKIAILGGRVRSGVVDRAGDTEPTQLPTGIARNTIPEPSLSTAIALTEGMNVVELVVVVREASDESPPIHTSQLAVLAKLFGRMSSRTFDHGDGHEVAGTLDVLANVDGAQLAGPPVDG